MNADDCITVMKLIDVAIKQERKNFEMMFDGISSLIKKAIEDEREECAKVCDAESTVEGIAQKCASAIRARGKT